MSELNLVSFQVADPVNAATFYECIRGLKLDGARSFWARALDWLIAMQKRRAKIALQRYYDEH